MISSHCSLRYTVTKQDSFPAAAALGRNYCLANICSWIWGWGLVLGGGLSVCLHQEHLADLAGEASASPPSAGKPHGAGDFTLAFLSHVTHLLRALQLRSHCSVNFLPLCEIVCLFSYSSFSLTKSMEEVSSLSFALDLRAIRSWSVGKSGKTNPKPSHNVFILGNQYWLWRQSFYVAVLSPHAKLLVPVTHLTMSPPVIFIMTDGLSPGWIPRCFWMCCGN